MTIGYNLRVEKNIKNEAEKIFNSLGFTLSAAINAFLKASIRSKGFPFKLKLEPQFNKETIEAMIEAEKIANDPNHKGYKSVKALMKALMD